MFDINDLIEKYNILLLLTFGSYNTDRFNEKSDIDIGFLSGRILTCYEEEQLLYDLIVFFKRDRIDLVNLSKAGPLLLYKVACNCSKVFYEEDNSHMLFKLKASARYAETRFLRRARSKYLEEQLELI